ncbi:hypothetical protein FA13DRAFT_1807191 [Coprinellus micaceus]|uniref:Uncharacterized protein n=1 Tax=Coprinellus micaceus TaxID=71717 RepID=A0A4Y7RBW4_COPMI|nr:hypothetical protein FA13DRAFT_1807191 [Coprinellus micaceus]
MASPPLRLDYLTAQQWPSCYHYYAIRIYFAISAWNKVLKEVAWASTVGTIARGHGAVLEQAPPRGLVAEVTNIMLHKERAANPTDLRNFLARWESRADKDILTAQALFNFYAHRRNVIVAFPSTVATMASERYMAQAMNPSAPTTDLLGEGIVDAQMGMHVVAKRRQEVEWCLDELEQVILDVELNTLITGREGMRKMAEIIRDWRLGIH